MNATDFTDFAAGHWRPLVEILLLAAGIFTVWFFIRATRGARVLTGLAVLFLGAMLVSQIFELHVLGWLLRNVTLFIAFAMVVVFQPELRRFFSALGSHRLLSFVSQSRESVEVLTDATFDLANRQLGALIAIERENSLDPFVGTGVTIDSELSSELLVTIFHPKTPLHDGGVLIRSERIVSAACIFPVSQRSDLDRNLGLRHRAGLGLTEEFDSVVIVVSEETGIVSICHHGIVERNFDAERFKTRLGELLSSREEDEEGSARPTAREDRAARARRHPAAGPAKEQRDDRLAF